MVVIPTIASVLIVSINEVGIKMKLDVVSLINKDALKSLYSPISLREHPS